MIYFWKLQRDLDITSKHSYTAFLEYQFLSLMQILHLLEYLIHFYILFRGISFIVKSMDIWFHLNYICSMYHISLYCSYLHFNHIDGVIGGMLTSRVVDHRFNEYFNLSASPLRTNIGFRIMCPLGRTCLPVDCCLV